MIKKVKTEQLVVGMYVHDFNCGWLSHPFIQSQMKINDKSLIEQVKATGIRELYIDTSKGLDINDAPTAEEASKKLNREFKQSFRRDVRPRKKTVSKPAKIPYRQEMEKARVIRNEARNYIDNVLSKASAGKMVELDAIDPIIDNMVESISRNENALISLFQVKKTDEYTFMHSLSVSTLLIAFAKFLKLPAEDIRNMGIGGMLHDIGKMKIPLEVLNKPGKLTDDEFVTMKNHVVIGRQIIKQNQDIEPLILQVASEHHERFDGTGYPYGYNGDKISLGGQLAAIVDVYDALSSDRIYHKGMSPADTVKKLFEWSKYHFDPELVHKFIVFIGIFPIGTLVRLSNEKLGVVIAANRSTPLVRVFFDTKRRQVTRIHDIDLAEGIGQSLQITGYENAGDLGINISTIIDSI